MNIITGYNICFCVQYMMYDTLNTLTLVGPLASWLYIFNQNSIDFTKKKASFIIYYKIVKNLDCIKQKLLMFIVNWYYMTAL